MQNSTPDEKVYAALSHLGVLFSFAGPLAPLLIWISQRGKSRFIRFQALQAMTFQAFGYWAGIIGIFAGAFLLTCAMIALVPFMTDNPDNAGAIFLIQPYIFLGIFGGWGLYLLVGIAGAVACMLDRDFRYPFIGRWLERRFEAAGEGSSAHEDDLVSGISHATAILQMMGMLTPLIAWMSEKERSPRIRFQAMQALVYQLIGTVAYFAVSVLGVFFYMVFIAVILAVVPDSNTTREISPAFGGIMIAIMTVFAIMWALLVIAGPLYLLLALVAAVRTIQGHDFRYPILGGMIARRLERAPPTEISPT